MHKAIWYSMLCCEADEETRIVLGQIRSLDLGEIKEERVILQDEGKSGWVEL